MRSTNSSKRTAGFPPGDLFPHAIGIPPPGLKGGLSTAYATLPAVDLAAVARLEGVAITTFAVDTDLLASRLAPGVRPERFELGDGPSALVSAVSFRIRRMHLRGLAWPRFTCGHVDHRAYVRHGDDDERAVWFLGAWMDSRLAAIPRR